MMQMEAENREHLRRLPGVSAVLQVLAENPLPGAPTLVAELVRREIEKARRLILEGEGGPPSVAWLAERVHLRFNELTRLRPRVVINATGVLVHTNLGRSPLAPAVAEHIRHVASTYGDLEYNLGEGTRGSRLDHIRELLQLLTGAEDALVVNNNAAAVLLALAGLSAGKEVVVSRGELVEIGGSFRIPEVLEQTARLREVGTTNRTHLRDYENAINDQTGMLLKVHASNYRVVGFTADVGLEELVRLGRDRGIPVVVDLGSGAFVDVGVAGLKPEPMVSEIVGAGVDVVTFSGDKLLGGPQAGVALGKRGPIGAMNSHPLARAMRADKMLLAGIHATLAMYMDPENAKQTIPLLKMMFESLADVKSRADSLCRGIKAAFQGEGHDAPGVRVEPSVAAIGGGSLPGEGVGSYAVVLNSGGRPSASGWERALRRQEPPVVVRVQKEMVALDVRTLGKQEVDLLPDLIVSAWNAAVCEEGN